MLQASMKSRMDTLIEKMLSEKQKIAKYEIEEYWLDIGQMKDFNHAQEVYETHFKGQ